VLAQADPPATAEQHDLHRAGRQGGCSGPGFDMAEMIGFSIN
jgi:hypothetical protein